VAAPLAAGGLSTTFADVVVQAVPLGQPVAATDGRGRSLVLRNSEDVPVRIRIEALVPSKDQLRGGAKAIPDLRWISISPSEVDVPALGEKECRVAIQVPAQWRFRHNLYQVMLWSHTEPPKEGGVVFSAGLLSRLRFRTGK